ADPLRSTHTAPRSARSATLAAAVLAAATGCGPGGWLADRPAGRLPIEKPPRPTGSLDGAVVYSKDLLTETYTIDRIYTSMTGPMGTLRFQIEPGGRPELLWVTGFEAVMTAPDGETEMSREFMCHSNL